MSREEDGSRIAEGPYGLETIDFYDSFPHPHPFTVDADDYVAVRRRYYVTVTDADDNIVCDAFCGSKSELQQAEQFLLDLCNAKYP